MHPASSYTSLYVLRSPVLLPHLTLFSTWQMGLIAFYTGIILNYLFCKLDSDRYPIATYSDIGHRVMGSWMRHLCTVLQTLQLIVNVGTLILSNAQSLAQISSGKLCFVVGLVIWMAVGMILGQIRSLSKYGYVANFAVWFNLL